MTTADIKALLASFSDASDRIENGINTNFDLFIQTMNAMGKAIEEKDKLTEASCVMIMTELFYSQSQLGRLANKGFRTIIKTVS
jgi:hypothetical protein